MLDTGLPDRIKAKGVPVNFVPGWQLRSAGSFNPRGGLLHHTAGSPTGTTPSLGICTFGRSDLPGPLCQVLQSRESSGMDHAYIVAAGRANHAGSGGWNGLTGNSSVHGLEVEHVGTKGVPQARLEVSARIVAAFLEAPGSTRNAGYACQHKEWAPSRKIDFYDLAPWFTNHTFRQRVAYWIGRTATVPKPPAPPPPDFTQGDDQMIYSTTKTTDGFKYTVHLTNGKQLRITGASEALYKAHPDYVGEIQYDEAQRYDKVFGNPIL